MIKPVHRQPGNSPSQSISEVESKKTPQETSTENTMLQGADRLKQMQTNNRLPLGAGRSPVYDSTLNNPEQTRPAQRAWVAYDRTISE